MIQAMQQKAAVAYFRMSTDEQSASIPDQTVAQVKWCEDNNVLFRRDYTDSGISGDQWDRPAFQRLLYDVQFRRDFDYILVWDSSRFSRLPYGKAMKAYGEVFDAGVTMITLSNGKEIRPDNVVDSIMLSLQQFSDQDKLIAGSLAVSRRHANLIAEGKWARGMAPYGWRIDLGPRVGFGRNARREGSHCLTQDPAQAPWVRVIFDKFVHERMTCSAIAQWLRKQPQIPTQFKDLDWTHGGVKYVLQNVAHIGHSRSGVTRIGKYNSVVFGTVIESKTPGVKPKQACNEQTVHITYNTHKPLIPLELFEQAQQLLQERRQVRTSKHQYPLAGLLYCGHCGGRLTAMTTGNRDGSLCQRYRCVSLRSLQSSKATATPTNLCAYTVNGNAVYEKVRQIVLERCLSDDKLAGYRNEVQAYLRRCFGKSQNAVQDLDVMLAECDKQTDRYRKLLGKTDDDDLIIEYQAGMKASRDRHRELLKQKETQRHLSGVGEDAILRDTAAVIDKLRDIRQQVLTAPPDSPLLRASLHQVIDRIDIYVESRPQSRKSTGKLRRFAFKDLEIFFKPMALQMPGSTLHGHTVAEVVNRVA